MKYKIGQLVESFSYGFGRIVEILSNDAVVVHFPYAKKEIIYCVEAANLYLTILVEQEA